MVKKKGAENPKKSRPNKSGFVNVNAEAQVDPKLLQKFRDTRQPIRKSQMFEQIRVQKQDAKRERRSFREKERKALKTKAPAKLIPKTKERMRKPDQTFVETVDDEEIVKDEADDEFSKFYADKKNPKILITTCEKPSFRTRVFVKEALYLFPNSVYRPRKDYKVKEIIQFCVNRGFTDVVVVGERLKKPFELIISHLPEGPTATFRISNFLSPRQIENVADRTKHYPELNLKNFDTRLGRRVSRMLEAMFPATRDYEGRAIATFHNQRDFIFVRVHRYVFDDTEEVRIQELGPRFTLRLLSLQQGTFDTKFGEYEWFRKKEHDADKKEWYL